MAAVSAAAAAPRLDPAGAPTLRAAVGQLFLPVGDLAGNRDRIVEAMAWAESVDADILVLPELAVTGYPPEDLLHSSRFIADNLAVLDELAEAAGDCVSVVGFVDTVPGVAASDATPRGLANAVALLYRGRLRATYHKALLPNYGVFDERRYFEPGTRHGGTYHVHSAELGLAICEDIWRTDIPDAQAADGAQALLASNASPYHREKPAEREEVVTDVARRCGMPVVYANLVGGQDEVVFDGGSLVADAAGNVVARAPLFEESCFAVDVRLVHSDALAPRSTFVCRPVPRAREVTPPPPPVVEPVSGTEEAYRALVRGLADFVTGHDASLAVVGLSGGIDSALVAVLASDALSPDRVWGVSMPGPQSPDDSVPDATALAERLGIRHDVVPIGEAYELHSKTLVDRFDGGDVSAAEEGLAPRIRSTLLLSLADRFGGVVLPTANKTESAVGYGTLHGGEMAGHLAILWDVPKTLVYELCRWRTQVDGRLFGWRVGAGAIPERILDKAPSAERTPARPDRELPASYDVVDGVLERLVEFCQSPDEVVQAGFDADVVQRVVDLVDRNEHVRRQAPLGVKVTSKAFGRDRRVPLTHGYRQTVTPPGEPYQPLPPTPIPDAWLEG